MLAPSFDGMQSPMPLLVSTSAARESERLIDDDDLLDFVRNPVSLN
jgi:hypothetical protein